MLVEVALVDLLAKQVTRSVPKSFGQWVSSCTLLCAKQVIAQGTLLLAAKLVLVTANELILIRADQVICRCHGKRCTEAAAGQEPMGLVKVTTGLALLVSFKESQKKPTARTKSVML